MTGLLSALVTAPAGRILFTHDGAAITAGAIRSAAQEAVRRIAPGDGPIFLHTESAALLAAGLLAAASLKRPIAILPHAQPAYLAEVGANAGSLLTDQPFDESHRPTLVLGAD